MSISATIDNIKYAGIDKINVGGKTINLETDVSAPSGSIGITENGTYDVSAYAEAVVNVQGECASGGAVLEEFEVTLDTTLGDYGGIKIPVSSTGKHIYIIKTVTSTGPRPPKLMTVLHNADNAAYSCAFITYANLCNSIAASNISITDGVMTILGTTLAMFNDAGQSYIGYHYAD